MSVQLLASESGVIFHPLFPMIVLPVVGAVVLNLVPRSRGQLFKQIAVSFSALSCALSIYIIAEFDRHDDGFQFVTNWQWSKTLGISFHLGIDGISLFLVALTGVLFTVALMAIKPEREPKAYYTWMLVLMTGCLGTFVALDLVVFFLFFEIVLIPMYFLIGLWGHGDRIYATTKFFIFTTFGSGFMLVGILATAFLHQKASGGALTFDVVKIAQDQSISTNAARWIFLSFAFAFAVKTPLFPVHTWLPDAHTEASTGGSVILAGILLKLGTYGFVRFGLYLFPEAAHFFAPLLLTLGFIGIIYGAVCAAMQKDLKRLIAYSSVAHLGFIILGVFSLNTEGITGGVYQMLNHGITTPVLFMLVGIIYGRWHTRQIAELGGLQRVAPIFAGVFMLAMLASVGLPGLNGFPGEFLSLLGAFKNARWWGAFAASGVILAAVYLLWAYQRVFHGKPHPEHVGVRDLSLSEGLGLAPLLVLIVVMGVYPTPFLQRIEPSVKALVEHVRQADPTVDNVDVPVPMATGEEGGHK